MIFNAQEILTDPLFSDSFTYIPKSTTWGNDGKPIVSNGEPQALTGVIRPLNTDDLRYTEGGTYTREDIKVYCTQALNIGDKVEWNGKTFTIQEERNNERHGGFYRYYCRREGK